MDGLFENLSLIDVHKDLVRNIPSRISSTNLFDDLSDSPEDWATAIRVEQECKPNTFISAVPIIHRPFEDADWENAIGLPFNHWSKSRYTNGSYGVWYGADSLETSVYESAFHWHKGLLADAGFDQPGETSERKVFLVRCDAILINLKGKVLEYPQLTDRNDYSCCQNVVARLHHEGYPGLVTHSVRNLSGETYAILGSQVLSTPRIAIFFSYELLEDVIIVKEGGKSEFLTIDIRDHD